MNNKTIDSNIENKESLDEFEEEEILPPKNEPLFEEYSNTEYIPTDPAEIEKYLSSKVKLRWSRVIIVSFVISIVLVLVSLLVIWIISLANAVVWYLPSWIFFIECGILLIFGGCMGTMKQSFTIDRIKVRFFKGEKITWADTKIAVGSAYSYIFAGIIIGIASLVAWAIGH